MVNLQEYGWNSLWEKRKAESAHHTLEHGRVINTHKTRYDVITTDGILSCELTGNFLYGKEPHEYPTTGDWVLLQRFDGMGIIVDILERTNTLTRKKSGTKSEIQNFATNVDKAFLVQSIDNNFNIRRLERFLVQVTDAKIEPVVVFTKTDLGCDTAEIVNRLGGINNKAEIYFTSMYDSQSIDRLRKIVVGNQTFIVVGSSGVGKSTLINQLCGNDILDTSAISTAVGKGRHTSSRREMVILQGGGILLDTPGIRELGLTAASEEAITEALDIDLLTDGCRFSDCKHIDEPGCAVLEMVRSGRLDRAVYDSYLKLRREMRHFNDTVYEKRKSEKQFARIVKTAVRFKKNR